VKAVVAGVGSEYRRDDGVGQRVAVRVAAEVPGTHDVSPIGDPLDLLGVWDDADLAVVVDATHSGALPGTIRCVELPTAQTGGDVVSTHGMGLPDVLRLARAVDRAPKRVVVVGIEGADFGRGEGLTAPVEAAVDIAVERVAELIREVQGCA
jgi:hydrogenase maturation protease